VAADPAPEQRAHAPAGRARRHPRLERPGHLELLPHVRRARRAPGLVPPTPDRSGSLGLDAKLGLTSNFTLDATFNPDFGQVEADPSVVNLTATRRSTRRSARSSSRAQDPELRARDQDQLFYSRRIGQAPSLAPRSPTGETLRCREHDDPGRARKSRQDAGGLSVGVLQSFTQKENAHRQLLASASASRRRARGELHGRAPAQGLGQGQHSLGGMLTWTERFTDDPAARGAADARRDRRVRLHALLREPQPGAGGERGAEPRERAARRDDRAADGRRSTTTSGRAPTTWRLDLGATSLSGHGGSLRFGLSGETGCGSPTASTGTRPASSSTTWATCARPTSCRTTSSSAGPSPLPGASCGSTSRSCRAGTQWDFGGLAVQGATEARALGIFRNKWGAEASVSYEDAVDTRMLRGGPALRWHDFVETRSGAERYVAARVAGSSPAEAASARDDDSRSASLDGSLSLRLSNRLVARRRRAYERLDDNLQYAATAEAGGERALRAGPASTRTPGASRSASNSVAHARADASSTTAARSSGPAATRLQAGDRHAGAGQRRPLPALRHRRDRLTERRTTATG
jgi:hypothetical protein